jgi:hypothetical protein
MTQWTSTINLAGVEAAIAAAAERAVLLGGEHVLGESSKVVPIEEATLSRSGKATAETQGDVAVAAVSYDTPYAARQHEELDYRHDEGRTAKYLETPLHAEADTVLAIAANEVKKVLR